MKCDFCGHEVDKGTVECPYCHYRFKIDPQVLTPEERDTFDGVTIDESTSTAEDSRVQRQYEQQEYDAHAQGAPNIKVHHFGCGSGMLMTLLILCAILAVFFFLLPTFVIFGLIGAVVVYIMRLFM